MGKEIWERCGDDFSFNHMQKETASSSYNRNLKVQVQCWCKLGLNSVKRENSFVLKGPLPGTHMRSQSLLNMSAINYGTIDSHTTKTFHKLKRH